MFCSLSCTHRALLTIDQFSFNSTTQKQFSPTKSLFLQLCFHLHPWWLLLQPPQEEKNRNTKNKTSENMSGSCITLSTFAKQAQSPAMTGICRNHLFAPHPWSCLPPTLHLTQTGQQPGSSPAAWIHNLPRFFWCLNLLTNSTNLPVTQWFLNFYSKTDSVLHLFWLIYCYQYFYFNRVWVLKYLMTSFFEELTCCEKNKGKRRDCFITTLASKGIKGIPSHIPLAVWECS